MAHLSIQWEKLQFIEDPVNFVPKNLSILLSMGTKQWIWQLSDS